MWKHKKYGKRLFKGNYYKCRGKRTFVLTSGERIISFNSWQMARGSGWEKVK